jgi:hypothetical protein
MANKVFIEPLGQLKVIESLHSRQTINLNWLANVPPKLFEFSIFEKLSKASSDWQYFRLISWPCDSAWSI